MEQRRAINALEPFVLLSSSATSPRGAADLILQATSSPNTYVFAELLQTPNIQALRNSPEYSSHLRLLEIYSYGTFADYKASSNLPKLTPSQTTKLQYLSLLSLASTISPLPYKTLQTALYLPDATALESLVSTANAASLLTGTLDSQAQLVYIDSIAPLRDLAPASLIGLTEQITQWSARCASVLKDLEDEQAKIRENARARQEEQGRLDAVFERKLKQQGEMAGSSEEKGGRVKRVLGAEKEGEGDGDAMDLDDEGAGGKKGVKRSLLGMMRSGGK